MGKLIVTIVGVIVAVAAFSALWVGANLLFSQVRSHFSRFSAIAGGVVGALFFAILDGNRLLTGIAVRPDGFEFSKLHVFLFWPIVGALLVGGLMFALSKVDDRTKRLAIGIAGGIVIGLVVALTLKSRYHLALRSTPLTVWPLALAAAGAGMSAFRGKDMLRGALTGAFFGWTIGTFGGALHGISQSSLGVTILAGVVAGGLLGARIGLTENPDLIVRARIDDASRSWIFVGPAVLFASIALIIPTILTLILSLQDNRTDEFVGLDNYQTVLSDSNNFDASNFSNFWGSELLIWGLFFALAGVALAVILGRETKQPLNFSGPPLFPLILAGGLLSFALFTALRGTIINNLWWVVAVTLISTSLGLAVAKLADGAKFESVAKSFVFMPMAISMVGASIIWRLMMYQARNVSSTQTGLFNAIWVWLGTNTTTNGFWRVAIGGVFALAVVWLLVAGVRNLSNSPSVSVLYWVIAAIPGWVALRTFTDGIGGYAIREGGEIVPATVNFVQDGPYNNFFLMMVLIWSQTGFAMVILSAAIKAVPGDFIEAAQLDGATEGQVFWRITVPQIMPTIAVVATTTMVSVMKVFDIVKVTTNGQFDSQVLANAMFNESFQLANFGTGSVLAILLFLGVLPVMIYNILNLTKEH